MDTQLISQQVVGLLFMLGAAAFFLVLKWLNIRRYQIKLEFIHKERLIAMEKGIPMPEVPDYDPAPRSRFDLLIGTLRVNPRWPLGIGILLILGGAGTLLALMYSGDPYHRTIWPFGLIPIFLGVGLWLQYFVMRPGRGDDRR